MCVPVSQSLFFGQKRMLKKVFKFDQAAFRKPLRDVLLKSVCWSSLTYQRTSRSPKTSLGKQTRQKADRLLLESFGESFGLF